MTQPTKTEQLLHTRMGKLGIDELPPALESLPPTMDELPYDDGEPMESPWHANNGLLLKASYAAHRGGRMDDYFIGTNMFFYYSTQQVRNKDYKGPDFFFVKDVDGTRHRLSWVVWEEHGRFPNVIIEFLSKSTETQDVGEKKQLYEQVFRTPEYFCAALNVERLYGRRLRDGVYTPIEPDKRGWLWSEQFALWLGPWRGLFAAEEWTWLRLYYPDGSLVPIADELAQQQAEAAQQHVEAVQRQAEAAQQHAEAAQRQAEAAQQHAEAAQQHANDERKRADDLANRLVALEAELQRLRDAQIAEE